MRGGKNQSVGAYHGVYNGRDILRLRAFFTRTANAPSTSNTKAGKGIGQKKFEKMNVAALCQLVHQNLYCKIGVPYSRTTVKNDNGHRFGLSGHSPAALNPGVLFIR